jgi:hypothetical protein
MFPTSLSSSNTKSICIETIRASDLSMRRHLPSTWAFTGRATPVVYKRVYDLGKYHDEEAAAQVYAKAACKYKKSKAPPGVYGGLDLSSVPEQRR